jgi:cystathionine beta-synthase
VEDGSKLRGIVHEVDMLRHLVTGHGTLDSSISSLVESDYATVTPSTKIELLKGVLSDAKLAIVLDHESVTGVITKIDLIDYLAQKAQPVSG